MTLKRLTMAFGCGLLLGGLTALGADAERLQLKLRWPAGKRLIQRQDVRTVQQLHVPQSETPVTQIMEQRQDTALWVQEERADGSRDVALEVLAIKHGVRVGNQRVIFDSSRDSSTDGGNPAARLLRGLVGRRLVYRFDANGEVQSVAGIADLQSAGGAQQALTEDYFKEMMSRNMTYGLPAEPVGPGSRWTHDSEVPMPGVGTLVMRMSYRFARWEQAADRRCALLVYAGELSLKPGSAGSLQGMTVTETTGAVSGRTWFSPELGVPVVQHVDQELELTLRPNASDAAPPVTSSLHQQRLVKLLRVEELPATP